MDLLRYLWLPTVATALVVTYALVFFNVDLPIAVHLSAWCALLAAAIALSLREGIRIRRAGLNKLEIVLAESYLVFMGAIGALFVIVGFLIGQPD